jgi:hypothetical protein
LRFISAKKRAPTSTKVAQTLSIKARQCQDDRRSLDANQEIGPERKISVDVRSVEVLCEIERFPLGDEWLALFRFVRCVGSSNRPVDFYARLDDWASRE